MRANPCAVVNIAATVAIDAIATPFQRPGHLVRAHTVRTAQKTAKKYWNDAIPNVQISYDTGQKSKRDATMVRGGIRAGRLSSRPMVSIFHMRNNERNSNAKPIYISSIK